MEHIIAAVDSKDPDASFEILARVNDSHEEAPLEGDVPESTNESTYEISHSGEAEDNSLHDPKEVQSEPVLKVDNGDDDSAHSSKSSGRVVKETERKSTYNFLERLSMRVANRPCLYFWASLFITLAVGLFGLIVGEFQVSVESAGWTTRGTLIANRQTQFQLVDQFASDLFQDSTGTVWLDLINNVQEGWETDDDSRRLLGNDANAGDSEEVLDWEAISVLGSSIHGSLRFDPQRSIDDFKRHASKSSRVSAYEKQEREAPFMLSSDDQRILAQVNSTSGGLLEDCDTYFYSSGDLLHSSLLWPVWRTKRPATTSFLDPGVLQELCEQEKLTQQLLEEAHLCRPCGNTGRCLLPFSLVFFVRLQVDQDFSVTDCGDLTQLWIDFLTESETSLVQCVSDLKSDYDLDRDGLMVPESCPNGFFPSMIDESLYETTTQLQYSSSIFATYEGDLEMLFDAVDSFATGGNYIDGAYDTQYEDFVNIALDDQLIIDMSLALGSALVTIVAMIIHTRSPFLSLVGLLQIILSFPLAFFVYTFLAGLEFFPFLNFIGIFVLFALGADDVFVAVDKWKNVRLVLPDATTAEVAAIALPDAAMAMFLTTLTTAVAFFGTAVCPVAPIRCFAVFCGLLIVMDYIMCVLLVFPALCIYDRNRHKTNCCCRVTCCSAGCDARKKSNDSPNDEEEGEDTKNQDSLVRRVLKGYFSTLHRIRWILLGICGLALVLTAFRAASIEMPTSSDVRLYDESDNQYEQNYVWRQRLLYSVLEKQGGSSAYVVWGIKPADTGDHNNPDTWSQLVLDESFTPSDTGVQQYLRDFCDRFFSNDFATRVEADFECPMNSFEAWLQHQSTSEDPDSIYVDNCSGASQLPIPEDTFDACLYAWSQNYFVTNVLARDGKVEIIYFGFNSRVRYDSHFDDLDDEWNLIEGWFDTERQKAPEGANNVFFTSEDFWWYDTNGAMLDTAFASAGIALAAAAAVILFSSRSFVLTIFATATVGFVLTSVTAILVAIGWTLGFLESILFAILIGISCDFVIHFSHAYASLPGEASRSERTQHALIMMGPSILAAAFTTFAAALVMLFTIITFFEKFAVVLFLTILQSLLGSFVVFLTLTACVGPSNPTYLFDWMMGKIGKLCLSSGDKPTGDNEA